MKHIFLLLLLTIFAPIASAAEGAVCITEEKAGVAAKPVDAKTTFSCEGIKEKKTIAELYKAGWTVAHMVPQTYFKGSTTFLYWMLIIEKK